MRTPVLLLCLLWCLVEVHSQTEYPYISLMGETLPNHAYVNLSLVGGDDSGSDSVRCHTDLNSCCTHAQVQHHGDWHPPGSDTRLPFLSDLSADINFMKFVGLRELIYVVYRNNADMPSGIYCCRIATNAVHGDVISVRDLVYMAVEVIKTLKLHYISRLLCTLKLKTLKLHYISRLLCIHHNGDITVHLVQYGVVGSGSTQTMNVSGGSVTEATISSLKSSTTYFIQVAAVNSAGIRVYSGSMNATTDGTHHNHSTLYNIIISD